MKKRIILGASIGNCVHVAGLYHFLKLAELEGYKPIYLGPAVSPNRVIEAIENNEPDIAALSYRLTPDNAENLFKQLDELIKTRKIKNTHFIFGGTKPVAEIAAKYKFFEKIFSGEETKEELKAYLRGGEIKNASELFPQKLIERIESRYPYPLLRHHFGRPTVSETINGVKIIAGAEILDIISLGPDQNAQEHFFHQERMNRSMDGAGGVPLRKEDDLKKIYEASRCGNYPLMRCYSGTNELQKWAEMSVATINNAWAAIPLTWYNVMDGRSNRAISDAVKENQNVIRWYAGRNIPVEINESHQWSLRDAHDSLAVAMAYIAAYNAKKLGVRNYISQYMFNTPTGTSPKMDLAKMLAKKELISSLHDKDYISYTEVRAGIAHFSSDPYVAKGQLASSAVISLSLKPHILHVVGFSEGDHAIYPEEVIESCKIIQGVIHNCLYDLPDYTADSDVLKRKNELINEAADLIEKIKNLSGNLTDDPLTDANTLSDAIKKGLLDTPHFKGNKNLNGSICTQLINGGWYAIDPLSGNILSEKERAALIMKKGE